MFSAFLQQMQCFQKTVFKGLWNEDWGQHFSPQEKPFLGQVRRGLRNTLPSDADARRPLLLPLIMSSPNFLNIMSEEQRILRFPTILGFIGMLRPHSLEALNPESFSIVTVTGEEIQTPRELAEFHAV